MLLVKIGGSKAESLNLKIWSKYRASYIPYYLESGLYLELKYRLRSSELHMEFYLDLLHNLCIVLGDSFLGI